MNASDMYGKRRQETIDKLQKIHYLLCQDMDAKQARTPNRYTHASELGYVNQVLDDLILFMKGK